MHIVTAVPLAPQLRQLEHDGFTVVLLRLGPYSAVAHVRVSYQLTPSAPGHPTIHVFALARLDMEELFAEGARGEALRAAQLMEILGLIELERAAFERQFVAPYGQNRAEA